MGYLRQFSRAKVLWVPVGAVVVTGALLAGTMFASAAAPNLPKKTPAQLLAAMRHATLPPAMTAVISENANLGFPALPDIAGLPSSALSAASWLAGSHTVQVWYSGPGHVRIAVPVSFGETDLRVNGSQVWLWQSQGQVATHIILAQPGQVGPLWRFSHLRPAQIAHIPAFLKQRGRVIPGAPPASVKLRAVRWKWQSSSHGAVRISVRWGHISLQQLKTFSASGAAPPGLAVGVLKAVTPLQAAQRLLAMLGPSTKVTVAGTTVVAGRPAYQLSIEPRSNQSLIGQILIAVDAKSYLPLGVQVIPRGSSSPAFSIGFSTFTPGQPAASNFTFTPPPGAHVHVVKLPNPLSGLMGIGGWPGAVPGQMTPGTLPTVAPAGPRVLGSDWLSVVVLPGDPATMAPRHGGTGLAGTGQAMLMLRTLLNSATRVHGAWGSGRLISTRLVNILITSKGQVLIGAVTPAVLYADAAKV